MIIINFILNYILNLELFSKIYLGLIK